MHRVVRSFALFVFCAFSAFGCGTKQATPAQAAQDLKRSIPLESTPAQVIQYLDTRKIEHSAYEHNSITAIIRDNSKWEIVKASYGVEFRFDDANRLSVIEVREHLTGP